MLPLPVVTALWGREIRRVLLTRDSMSATTLVVTLLLTLPVRKDARHAHLILNYDVCTTYDADLYCNSTAFSARARARAVVNICDRGHTLDS